MKNKENETSGKFFNVDRRQNVNLERVSLVFGNNGAAANINNLEGDLHQATTIHLGPSSSVSQLPLQNPINFGAIYSDSNFIGRSAELSILSKYFETLYRYIVVVCGLGGIGKTSIVRKFLENKKFRSYNKIWINAGQCASIQNDFESLAKNRLSITTFNADGGRKDFESIVNEVLSKLCNFPTLIVLDNVDDEEVQKFVLKFVHNVRPQGAGNHIANFVITSRIQSWRRNSVHVMPVLGLSDTDAIELVNKLLTIYEPKKEECAQKDFPEDIKKLVQLLQNFPLAIRQATAHINYERVVQSFSITNYIDEYNFHKKEYLDSEYFQKEIDVEYMKTTYTTWRVTISAIEKNPSVGNLALRILRIIAYFEADHIRRNIFFHLNHPHSENIIDERKIILSIRLLVEYSMIEGRDHQSILSVHRLVQSVMKINLESDQADMSRTALHDGLNILYKALYQEYAIGMKQQYFEDFAKTLEHATSVFAAVPSQVLGKKFPFNPPIVLEKAYGHASCSEYHKFGFLILSRLMDIFNETHPYVIATKAEIANVCLKMEKHAVALRMFEDVYAERVRILGEDHPKTTEIKLQIDKIISHEEREDEALQDFDKSKIPKWNRCVFL